MSRRQNCYRVKNSDDDDENDRKKTADRVGTEDTPGSQPYMYIYARATADEKMYRSNNMTNREGRGTRIQEDNEVMNTDIIGVKRRDTLYTALSHAPGMLYNIQL